MMPRTRRTAGTLLLASLLSVGCETTEDKAKDAACDPGGKRAAALAAEPALTVAPPGYQRVAAGIHPSTYDEIETRICNDVLLYFTLEPAPDGTAALRALERQLQAGGWDGVLVDAQVGAIAATKLIAGGKASLRGNVIAATHQLRVSVALPPAAHGQNGTIDQGIAARERRRPVGP